jgi:glucosyl-dolichyl phosphate glucuronosyltransferase
VANRTTIPSISAVVCTRNRAPLLARTLTSLVEQDFPTTDFEILVVDNRSTDDTADIVRGFNAQSPVRYLREDNLGLCFARNAGWRAASGNYIAYLDDDAIASPGWLSAIRAAFAADPLIGAVGGPCRPLWGAPRPQWLTDELLPSLTVLDWGPTAKVIENIDQEWIAGANMAVPKRILEQVGGFHPRLDRVGNNLLSSGDIFLLKAICRHGYRCFYQPEMIVGHLVPASRLTQQWFCSRYYWQGISDAAMQLLDEAPSPAGRVRLATRRISRMLRTPKRISSLVSRGDRPQRFSETCFALIDVGYIAGLFGAAKL